eukprot:gene6105-6722_t
MANATDSFAQAVHGTNPQYLVEKITRLKIYNCPYWKEECFGLTAATLIDKAAGLKYCGGLYGGNLMPTKFLCLVLKLLQLQPEREIIYEFIGNEDFKYVRALGAIYLRLVGKAEEVYHNLEPLYNDYRKLAYRGMDGWKVIHMDEFVDSLLREELVCDIAMPHMVKREKLEALGQLSPRRSVLEDELLELEEMEAQALANEVLPEEEDDKEEEEDDRGETAVAFDDDEEEEEEEVTEGERRKEVQVEDKKTANEQPQVERGGRHTERDNRSRDRLHHRSRSPSRSPSRDRDSGRYYGRERRPRSGSRERGRDSRDRYHSKRSHRYRSPSHSDHSPTPSDRSYDSRDRRKRRRRSRSRDDRRDRRSDSRHRDRRGNYERERERDRQQERDEGKRSEEPVVPVKGSTAPNAPKAKAKMSEKAFDRIFGKKSAVSKASSGGGDASATTGATGKVIVNAKGEKVFITAPEGSVEYWNQIRESLGMSKLRP